MRFISAPSRQLFHVFSIFFLDLTISFVILLLFCQDLEIDPQNDMVLLARAKLHPF